MPPTQPSHLRANLAGGLRREQYDAVRQHGMAAAEPEIAPRGRMDMRMVLRAFGNDVRHTVRAYRRTPFFTFVAVATLTLGIGSTTTIFSVLDAVVLRPLPYPAAGRARGDRATSAGHRRAAAGVAAQLLRPPGTEPRVHSASPPTARQASTSREPVESPRRSWPPASRTSCSACWVWRRQSVER